MKITIDVPDENIHSALAEPHIRYWAESMCWRPGSDIGAVLDKFEHKWYELHSKNLQTGLELMARITPVRFQRVVDGMADGVDGDVLVQLMAFGELKYG